MTRTRFFLVLAFGAGALLAACGGDTVPVTPTTSSGGSGGSGGGTGGVATSSNGGSGGTTSNGGSGGIPDTTPPAAITDFEAATTALGGIDLSWTNPGDSDLAGVLVVPRGGDTVDFVPTDGQSYTAAENVGAGQDVLYVELGTGTAQTPAQTAVGLSYNFAAWAFDHSLNYSEIASTDALNNILGTQQGQISVALDGTVTVNTQPDDLTLSGSASYNSGTDELTVSLVVQNDGGRLLFNVKGLSENYNQGIAIGPTFPRVIGKPSIYYGPEALDVAGSVSRDIIIGSVDGSEDPITFDIEFVDHPMLFGDDAGHLMLVDSSGSANDAQFDIPDQPKYNNILRNMIVSPDGRWVFGGRKSSGLAVKFGTVGLSFSQSIELSTNAQLQASIGSVAISSDGAHLYVGVNDGRHYEGGQDDPVVTEKLDLVELDPMTLTEVNRVTLLADAAGVLVKCSAISPDGTQIAIGTNNNGGIFLVDLATFTVIDTDVNIAGDQPISPSDETSLALAYDGSDRLFTAGQDAPNLLDVIDLTTYAVTPVTVISNQSTKRPTLEFYAGKLYWGHNEPDISVFDNALIETTSDTNLSGNRHALVMGPAHRRYFVLSTSEFAVYDVSNDERLDTDGDGNNGVTNAPLTQSLFRRHGIAISPF